MTSDQPVEGGLDEPTELEPEQGDLALADPADDHTRADWEAAAAAVLRKAGRLGDDDPDALVAAVASARFPSEAPPLYGDGRAAQRVAAAVAPA